jgi:deoxyribodipyrimidine photo-lyase
MKATLDLGDTGAGFAATRPAGLHRLRQFVPLSGRHYAEQRNYDLGPGRHAHVSQLSPYLRHRLITEAEVVQAVLERYAASTAAKFIQEVCWRTYWKGWLEMRPQLWPRTVAETARERARVLADAGTAARYQAALHGSTGIAPFDDWVSELRGTGYLHNHARMWFASLWIFTLRLPWQLGAEFFHQHLLDGDAASNTLSWRWVGGLHTRGKTYLARPSNIETYTQGRYAAVGLDVAVRAPPLEPDVDVPLTPLPRRPTTFPDQPFCLLVTEDDLGIETFDLDPRHLRATLLLDTAMAYPGVSDAVVEFKRAALADTAGRAGALWPAPVQRASPGNAADAGLAMLPADVTTLALMEPPVGPARDAIAPWLQAARTRGYTVVLVRRAWDDTLWPHARRGFFGLKDQIPASLRQLGLVAD